MITAPSASGPSTLCTVRNARMISWQYHEHSRFSGGLCIVMMKTLPACRVRVRLRKVEMVSRGSVMVVDVYIYVWEGYGKGF